MASRRISVSRGMSALRPRRLPRRAIWAADSSPLTYRVRARALISARACSSRGGLADARVAPQQHHAAAHQAAAQHPVELGQAGGQARRLHRLHRGQPHHLAAGGQGLETPGLGLLDGFGQGVPGQAVGALALPFAGLAAALGADVEGGRFGHGGIRAYSAGGNKKARRTGLFRVKRRLSPRSGCWTPACPWDPG
jgi:hypothetical protein